ncbi:hypothetical protein VP01_994g3 [Puccinia sorghi]|uniref:Uncharacterized protein n=1 Tax=Puccinia sorghi TaxID=27349 RepID=A0A0L6U5B2_9BASI|nr:hypothetical protein VP01_994g3 [Puccinia sorghi]
MLSFYTHPYADILEQHDKYLHDFLFTTSVRPNRASLLDARDLIEFLKVFWRLFGGIAQKSHRNKKAGGAGKLGCLQIMGIHGAQGHVVREPNRNSACKSPCKYIAGGSHRIGWRHLQLNFWVVELSWMGQIRRRAETLEESLDWHRVVRKMKVKNQTPQIKRGFNSIKSVVNNKSDSTQLIRDELIGKVIVRKNKIKKRKDDRKEHLLHAPAKLPSKLHLFACVDVLAQSLCSLNSELCIKAWLNKSGRKVGVTPKPFWNFCMSTAGILFWDPDKERLKDPFLYLYFTMVSLLHDVQFLIGYSHYYNRFYFIIIIIWSNTTAPTSFKKLFLLVFYCNFFETVSFHTEKSKHIPNAITPPLYMEELRVLLVELVSKEKNDDDQLTRCASMFLLLGHPIRLAEFEIQTRSQLQKVPEIFFFYSKHSPKLIKPSFDAQSLCRVHSDCSKTSTYANMGSLDGACCMSTAGTKRVKKSVSYVYETWGIQWICQVLSLC